jgi:hypothetical protein
MTERATELDLLLQKLDRLTAGAAGRAGDAIDEILETPRRATETRSLRNHPVLENFRSELSDGLIRADTANQLLRLIGAVLSRFS